jgi:endonuclease G
MPSPRQPSPAYLVETFLRMLAPLFSRGGSISRKTVLLCLALLALLTVAPFGWYASQSGGRKQEMARLISNYQQPHKEITFKEVLSDFWTLYFQRPFVPTQVLPGDGSPLFAGEPERASFPHEIRTLYNTAYTVGYCEDLANPAWVGYRVFDLSKKPVSPRRPGGFNTDSRTRTRVETGDYIGSGYDRGHMAPNYAIATRFGVAAQRETFLLSNICPQRHKLNAGLWENLEHRLADNYTGRYGQVWVVDGPVFGPEDRLVRLRNKVPVPVAFYMIILQHHEGGVRAEAFIMDQETPERGSLARYLTSIDEIERRTGLDFFPQMEKEAQAQLESQTAPAVW